MSERMKITKMSDSIYLLNDNDSGTAYLVLGSERALVIDTANGYENFYEIVRSLTDLPLMASKVACACSFSVLIL